jgi:hypothetical protein
MADVLRLQKVLLAGDGCNGEPPRVATWARGHGPPSRARARAHERAIRRAPSLSWRSRAPAPTGATVPAAVPGAQSRLPDTGPKVYRQVPGPIKAALTGARTAYPGVRLAAIIAAAVPPLPYSKVKLGPSGACLDFLALGECLNDQCTYRHDAGMTVPPTQVGRVAPKLKAAFESYRAAHPP